MREGCPIYHIRLATSKDIHVLTQLRLEFLHEIGTLPPEQERPSFAQSTYAYFCEKLPLESFIAWVAEIEGEIVGTSGLTFFERPPIRENFSGREAYIMNMYTRPAYRGRGIASALLQEILRYVKQRGIQRVWLHTTEAGRTLYEKTGFVSTASEMEMFL